MQLSVIIPTCNRNNLLAICLDKLSPNFQTIGEENYEVIVTDDSKENIAKPFLQANYPWVTWVEGPKRGPAANRNNGAKNAKGSWLVFIDDDCEPDKLLIESYQEAITIYPKSKAFEGAILPDNWDLLKKDMAECPINTEGNCFWSANVCIENKLFKSISGFDEIFLLAAQEDQDIYLRLKEVTEVVFIKDCVVVHPVRIVSVLKKIKKIKSSIQNWYLFVKKDNSFITCLEKGIKSQIILLYTNIKSLKIKQGLYHFCVIIFFFPIMLYIKIKNEK